MSTRCYIGMRAESGIVTAIYCHNDGYPTGVGETLKEYYTTVAKVKKLLKLGNISTLGENPIDYPELWDFEKHDTEDYKEKMEKGCRTYKGRGETGQEAVSFANQSNFMNYVEGTMAEWVYLFDEDGKEWYAQELHGMMPVQDIIDDYERKYSR